MISRIVLVAAVVGWFGVDIAIAQMAPASPYPSQLLGAWGGSDRNRSDAARQACESYKRNPKAVAGDLLVFQGNKKFSYGGYADYADQNISVKPLARNRWQITDRHYQDEEGGNWPGYRNQTYEATLNGDNLTLKEGKYTSYFNRCVVAQPRPAEPKLTLGVDLVQQLLKKCAEEFGFAGPIATCLENREREYGAELDQVYKKAFAAAGQKAELLRESQRAWLKFQQINCQFFRDAVISEGASFGRSSEAMCKLRSAISRLSELQAFLTPQQ